MSDTRQAYSDLDDFIAYGMSAYHLAGLAACIVKDSDIVWMKGYGWANIATQQPMSSDTLMNIASISKTVTATAVLQLWEDGRVNLDEDVNTYLPFVVRNPNHPSERITIRQLLTHTSSIGDSALYRQSYASGDPKVSLRRWIEGYLIEGGEYYRRENWRAWRPGERWDYSNVGFGLLGYLVETISDIAFGDYTRTRIFEPLGMKETSWYLADLDVAQHAIPYTYVAEGKIQGDLVTENDGSERETPDEGFIPNCLYSFPNIPDGLLRTSVCQLANFLIAYMNRGGFAGKRIMRANTVQEILSNQLDASLLPDRVKGQGLAWFQEQVNGGAWGHDGRDPGVSTELVLWPDRNAGVIVFTNTGKAALGNIVERLGREIRQVIL